MNAKAIALVFRDTRIASVATLVPNPSISSLSG